MSGMGTGEMPARAGLRHNMIVPYGAYACADGAVLFGIQNEREWRRFCAEVMLDSPTGRQTRASHRTPPASTTARNWKRSSSADFARLTRAEVIERLDRAGIANAAH